jgi:hypothetical protein
LDFHLSAHKKGINGWRFKTTSGLLLKVEEFERQYLQLNVSVPISEGWKKKDPLAWHRLFAFLFFFPSLLFRLFLPKCAMTEASKTPAVSFMMLPEAPQSLVKTCKRSNWCRKTHAIIECKL